MRWMSKEREEDEKKKEKMKGSKVGKMEGITKEPVELLKERR